MTAFLFLFKWSLGIGWIIDGLLMLVTFGFYRPRIALWLASTYCKIEYKNTYRIKGEGE